MVAAAPTALEALPQWARELSEKYYSRSYAMFVLYGNVRDVVPLRRNGGGKNSAPGGGESRGA